MDCPLCSKIDEDIIYENDIFRVILVDEIPGYIRVIANKHIKEFSELSDKEVIDIMLAIKKIEKKMIEFLRPDKVNIASLGNMVPHLHIHIIPRYENDPWWPGTTFCNKKRDFIYPPFDKEKYKEVIKNCF